MTSPLNPIAAVTHPDPYPYYAELVANKPLYYDEALGLWVASSAATVTAILNDRLCRVRPVAEPVPKALLGSPAAEIFRHLVRMNDGADHCPFKRAVSATLAAVDLAQAATESQRWARVLAERYVSKAAPEQLSNFAFHLPVYVVGSLLGFPPDMLSQLTTWIGDFVGGIAPTSDRPEVERGQAAAAELRDAFRSRLALQPSGSEGMLAVLAHQATQAGRAGQDHIVANAIGFLSQAYEASAGLIGNTLVALASQAELQRTVVADPAQLANVILEVLRYDPPIQNTRRFLAQDSTIAGQELHTGATVLVVLAAANRDPLANPHPAQFDPWRNDRRLFTFGHGVHACPGEALARMIAGAGIQQLLAADIVWPPMITGMSYRPSANARIPRFERADIVR